mgnify:FL=1
MHTVRVVLLWGVCCLTALVPLAVAQCRSGIGADPVTFSIHVVGCTDLQLDIAADNVTLLIERATGSITVSSVHNGTVLRIVDCTVSGNLTLRGAHSIAEVVRSTIVGSNVLVMSGTRNVTLAVADSTLRGDVVASVFADVVGVSITVINSTLSASRHAASVVGSIIRDVVTTVRQSRFTLNADGTAGGGPLPVRTTTDVGIIALTAGKVANGVVHITTSTINSKAATARSVGIVGANLVGVVTSWTNVTLVVSTVDVVSVAGDYVGMFGAAGGVAWTNVTVSCVLVNVSSAAGRYVGIVGAGGGEMGTTWRDVTLAVLNFDVESTAGDHVGILGVRCNASDVFWSHVTVAASMARITSKAGSEVGILGSGSRQGGGVTWTSVTVSVTAIQISSTAANFVAIVGVGSGSGAVEWTDVTLSAYAANVTSNASSYLAILGAANDQGLFTWVNVTIRVDLSRIVATSNDYVGILGTGTGEGGLSWRNVKCSAQETTVSLTAKDYSGILGAGSKGSVNWAHVAVAGVDSAVLATTGGFSGILGVGRGGDVAWVNVAATASSTAVTSIARDCVGILGSGCNLGAVTWINVSASTEASTITSTAGRYIGIVGAKAVRQNVTWTNVSISTSFSTIASVSMGYAGILGAGSSQVAVVMWTVVRVATTSSNVTSAAAGGFVGLLGVGGGIAIVVWTNVTISAYLSNVMSNSSDYVGLLGAGADTGGVNWTDVTISAVSTNIMCVAGSVVGVVGVGSSDLVVWSNVAVSVARGSVTSIARDCVGILGVACDSNVTWTNTIICVATSNLSSSARDYTAVLGAASGTGVTWVSVSVSASLMVLTAAARDWMGVLGAASYSRVVNWTDVNVSAARSNVTSFARDYSGVLGSGSGAVIDGGGRVIASWVRVAVASFDSNLTCQLSTVAGVLGTALATRRSNGKKNQNGTVVWRDVNVIAASGNLTVWAGDVAAVLGAAADDGLLVGVFVGAVEAAHGFVRLGPTGFVLAAPGTWNDVVLYRNEWAIIDTNSTVVCSNRTIAQCGEKVMPDTVAPWMSLRNVPQCVWDVAPSVVPFTDDAMWLSNTTAASPSPTAPAIGVGTTTHAEQSDRNLLTSTSKLGSTTASVFSTILGEVGTTRIAVSSATIVEVAASRNSTEPVVTIPTPPTSSNAATAVANVTTTPRVVLSPSFSLVNATNKVGTSRQAAVELSAAVATAALGLFTAPMAANKGTTMSRVLATRECRASLAAPNAEPEADSTQFVLVIEIGGSRAIGALVSTVLCHVAAAAAAATAWRLRRFPFFVALHLAALSYYGPNVVGLATVMLCTGQGGVEAASAGMVVNAILFGVAVASVWGMLEHHRPLWKDSCNASEAAVTRIYSIVDLTCAFLIAALSGARGLSCVTQGALICGVCFVNLAYAVIVRPAANPLDNVFNVVTTLLLFGLSAFSVTAPREPTYDYTMLIASAAVTAWMYFLLGFAVIVSVRNRYLRRRPG